jgi:hypothetical protein
MSSGALSSVPMKIDHSLPWEDKGGRIRGEVQLPAQLKMAGGVGEATCAACHLRGFMIVEHSGRFRRTEVPLESAEDFVAVGRKPVKGTSVGNIIFTKIGVGFARAREEFRGPREGSQVIRVSGIEHLKERIAAVRTGLRQNEPRDNAIERHLVAG